MKRTTLKDVAAVAKVSVATVSMAMNGHPDIAKKTVKRIKDIATSMGYVPDPVLSALSAYRVRKKAPGGHLVIGLITNWSTRKGWSKLASSQAVVAGLRARAVELGYELQEFWAREDGMSPRRLSDVLEARGIRGLILAPFENNDDVLDLDWSRFSVVTISRPSRYTRFHHVVQNQYMDMLNCWKRAWNAGYRRIGLVVQDAIASRWSYQWEAAYKWSVAVGGAVAEELPILRVRGEECDQEVGDWLKQWKPDAVIGRFDRFLASAKAVGFEVPRDFAYASLNVNNDGPEVSGILHRRDLLGEMAIDVLDSQLRKNSKGFQEISVGTQLDGEWVDGNTLVEKLPL